MENTTLRKRRSEKMTPEERRDFKKYVESFPTKGEAAEALKLSRVNLNRLLAAGSGKTDTIMIVKEAVAAFKQKCSVTI